MAFTTKYRFEFSDAIAGGQGLTAPNYRVNFLYEGYSGAIIELLPGEDPVTLELSDPTDNVFEPILPQEFTFSLACQEYWQAQDLYVTDGKQIQVLIERQNPDVSSQYLVHRRGWLSPAELKEDYGPKPYGVEVKAICGLALLKDIPLLNKDGKRLKGLISQSEVIRTALDKIGLGGNLVSGVNLYEGSDLRQSVLVNGLANPLTCPLYTTGMDAETFVKDDGTVMSCWDALNKILERDLQLGSLFGNWYVLRVPDKIGDWDPWNAPNAQTIHTRTYFGSDFTSAPVSHESIDLGVIINAPNNAIKVAADPSQYWKQTAQSGVRVEFEFGRWKSVLPDFSQYNAASTFPEGWEGQSLVPSQHYYAGTGTEDDPYRVGIYGGSDQYVNTGQGAMFCHITYPAGSREQTRYLKRTIKGRARLFNVRAAQIWAVIVRRENGPHLAIGNEGQNLSDWKAFIRLKKSEAVTTRLYNTYNVPYTAGNETKQHIRTKPGWFDITVELPIIDGVLEFYLYLGMAEKLDEVDPNIPEKVEYADIRMEVEEDGLNLSGMQQTIVRPAKTVKDSILKLELGDVPSAAVPYQRLGTLYNIPNGQVATTLWHRPDWPILPTGFIGNGGKPQTLLSWLTNTYASQEMNSPVVFEGDVIGDLPFGPFSVFRFTDAPDWKPQVLTRWKNSLRFRKHSVTAPELLTAPVTTPAGTPVPPVKEWQTPDGPVPMNALDDGTPIEPSTGSKLGDLIKLKSQLIGLGVLPAYPTAGTAPLGLASGTSGRFGAQVYNNGQYLGSVLALFRKQIPFHFPP